MLSVQPYGDCSTVNKVSFKAKREPVNDNIGQVSVKPFETHAGLKTGAIAGALEVGGALLTGSYFYALAALPIYAGCGAIVDHYINQKHLKLAKDIDTYGKKEALKMNNRAELTRNENIYYNSNTGLKIGALLGAVVTPIIEVVHSKTFKPLVAAVGLLVGLVGGAILGIITDYFSNNAAKEHADIEAARQKIMNK